MNIAATGVERGLRVLFAVLLVLQVVLLLCALEIVPWMKYAEDAAIMFALNLIFLLGIGKRLRKKRECCS